MTDLSKKKVLCGLSGGVDSSVAAYLLQQRGYEVIGVTLKLFQQESEIKDASNVAKTLGVDFYEFDFSAEFEKYVIDYFAAEYESGRTPNPCIICNEKIKWQLLLNKADELGAYYIATGHYANIINAADTLKDCSVANDCFAVEPAPSGKDQSYALCRLSSEQLARTLMPLGQYTKDEIREIAKKAGLPTASKSDSQDICFVPDGDYAAFLKSRGVNTDKPGNFVTTDGKILGRHKGIMHYTVGQRRGLGISAPASLFVLRIDANKNEVVLGYEDETLTEKIVCTDCRWTLKPVKKEIAAFVKIRYNHRGEKALVTLLDEDRIEITFANPVKSPAPGQSAVIYADGIMIGSGIIN